MKYFYIHSIVLIAFSFILAYMCNDLHTYIIYIYMYIYIILYNVYMPQGRNLLSTHWNIIGILISNK